MDCKMQVSAGQLPPCDHPPAPSLPCGAEPGATVGFPKRVDPFLLLVESWSSCFGRSGPPLAWPPYRKQGDPQDFLVSVETSSRPGGEASRCATFTPLPEGLALRILP